MTCNFNNKENLLAYLDNELAPELRLQTETHLQSCPECREEIDFLKRAKMLWEKKLGPKSVSPDFFEKVKGRIPGENAAPRTVYMRLYMTAAAGILILLSALWLFSPPTGSRAKPPGMPGTIIQRILSGTNFALPDGTRIVSSANTELALGKTGRQVFVNREGEFYLNVSKNDKPFLFNTPAGLVTVHGTEFFVTLKKGQNDMKHARWTVFLTILTGIVQLTTPAGDITGIAGESLYAEEDSAPKKQVENLALKFAGFYEKTTVSAEPEIPQYNLPLDLSLIANPGVLQRLSDSDAAMLSRNGFVVKNWDGDDFAEAYKTLQDAEIPVFVTTDALLHLYHLQFDETLREIEETYLYNDVCALSKAMLERMKKVYAESDDAVLKEAARRNVAYYNTALRLLAPESPVIDYVKNEVEAELANVEKQKEDISPIFNYVEDYSQYIPRGHYTRSETLKNYFKGLMWYGRLTFLIKGGDPFGPDREFLVSPREAKVQTIAGAMSSIALDDTILADNRTGRQAWERIYAVTSFYVGLADDLTPDEYQDCLVKALGKYYKNTASLKNENNFLKFKAEIVKLRAPAIYSGTGGMIVTDPAALLRQPSAETLNNMLETTKGFRLMGQRFVPDSYFMGQLVFPSVGTAGSNGMFTNNEGYRRFPRGLDVMAVLGSKRALTILNNLKDDDYKGYRAALEKLQAETREIKSDKEWNTNLYWGWMYCLKSLLNENWNGCQTFMTTPEYLDKNLNTVLGSWVQLRHDTILYAKQDYMVWAHDEPEPVTGYVEPVPEFFAHLLDLARMTRKGLSDMKVLSDDAKQRFTAFEKLTEKLFAISEKELRNGNLSEEEYAFIRDIADNIKQVCVKTETNPENGTETSADYRTTLIVDVHTDPNTGCVLEEGTGYLNLMIAACIQPDGRIVLSAGPVFSYYEFKHPMNDRLTDEKWREMLSGPNAPARPEWTDSFRQKK